MCTSKDMIEYCRAHNIVEVPVWDMSDAPLTVYDCDHRAYREVGTNIWMPVDNPGDVAYVGTSRHAGGVVLRPLFLKIDGVWRNAMSGRETDFLSWSDSGLNGDVRHMSIDEGPIGADAGHMPAEIDEPSVHDEICKPVQARDGADIWQQRCEALVKVCESFSWSPRLSDTHKHVCDTVAQMLECKEVLLNIFVAEGLQTMGAAYYTDGTDLFRWEGDVKPESVPDVRWMLEMDEPRIFDLREQRIPMIVQEGAPKTDSRCAIGIPLIHHGSTIGMCFALLDEMRTLDDDAKLFLGYAGRILGVFVKRMRDTRNDFEIRTLEERRSLSREIRDNVVAMFGSFSFKAAAVAQSLEIDDHVSALEDLARLEDVGTRAIGLLRNELVLLDMPLEEAGGFVAGVRRCLEQFEASWGIDTRLSVSGAAERYNMQIVTGLQLTWILGECLANILQHAHATRVDVLLDHDGRRYIMAVEDNGSGFDVDAVQDDWLGIDGMYKRAQAAGGKLVISSGPNGTRVQVDIPYQKTKWNTEMKVLDFDSGADAQLDGGLQSDVYDDYMEGMLW